GAVCESVPERTKFVGAVVARAAFCESNEDPSWPPHAEDRTRAAAIAAPATRVERETKDMFRRCTDIQGSWLVEHPVELRGGDSASMASFDPPRCVLRLPTAPRAIPPARTWSRPGSAARCM